MQTTPTFRCGGPAAAACITPWRRKKISNAAACHSATATHKWNQTFTFSMFVIFAAAAAASTPHVWIHTFSASATDNVCGQFNQGGGISKTDV